MSAVESAVERPDGGTTEVRCPVCFYRARWTSDGETVEVVQEGGVRQPSPHPTLAAWRVWGRSRAGDLGPVVGTCPRCAMPLVAEEDGLEAVAPWTLETPRGPVVVGADVLRGPSGPLTDVAAEAFFASQFQPDPVRELADPRLIFLVVVIAILAIVALFWLGAALFVANFLYAMGTQGNFSAPSVP